MSDIQEPTDKLKDLALPGADGHRARLRERFLTGGPKAVAEYELLEMVLFAAKPRGDVKPLAKLLLKHFGSFARVIRARPAELKRLPGVGDSIVAAVKTVEAAAYHMLAEEMEYQPVLDCFDAVLLYCRATMGFNKKEQFRIFFLDKKNRLMANEVQSEGTVDHTPVYVREVIHRALELGATGMILAHNHPTGDVKPSKSDISMTQLISDAAATVKITVHDHVILGKSDYYSFAANGMI